MRFAFFTSSIHDERSQGEVFVSEYSQPATLSPQPTWRSHDAWRTQESLPAHDFEGMPRGGFRSDWQLGRGTKRKERDTETARVALSYGRTTAVVQLGPKATRRVKAR
jgi:hypothetical protein